MQDAGWTQQVVWMRQQGPDPGLDKVHVKAVLLAAVVAVVHTSLQVVGCDLAVQWRHSAAVDSTAQHSTAQRLPCSVQHLSACRWWAVACWGVPLGDGI